MFNTRKIKTEAVSKQLLKYLDTPINYIQEGVKLTSDFDRIKKKVENDEKLTEKDKKILQRSSELVLLIQVTQAMNK